MTTPNSLPTTTERALAAAHCARAGARRANSTDRAAWLRAIAAGLDAAADPLVELAHAETRLTEGRLRGELARTSFQARLFAQRLEDGDLLPGIIDPADPEWPMGPRPDIRRGHVPVGPVLVFAASNFPFAFSVAGGDSVSALAAGCPVVVKIHPGHVELSREVARIVTAALTSAGAPEGLFSVIEGLEAGVAAVQDSRIRAVGFTGSLEGGRALFDLAVNRPDPIPFYGELGSTNPVVVTPEGWARRGDDITAGFVGSFTLGTGQFCTQPGVVLVPDVAALVAGLDLPAVDPMLNDRIRAGYDRDFTQLASHPAVSTVSTGPATTEAPAAVVLQATAGDVLADPTIVTSEVFGPVSIIVGYRDVAEAVAVLELFDGALTATVQGGAMLDDDAIRLLDVCSNFAGRVLWNQWPTGVTVSDAQQHGGPWPATTAPMTTSVGTAAALRFARPVAYQNVPQEALPIELRG
ncbi:aldehyde dehydrogenase (NADP(+)) [Aeromicrobium sp. P5_D10]